MNEKLDKLINNHQDEFEGIINKINCIIIMNADNVNKYSDEENFDVIRYCVEGFAKIAEYLIEYGNFKDTWDYDSYWMNLYGPELIIRSDKIGCDYKIGVDLEGVYIRFDLKFSDYIVYMDDEFWVQILSLINYKGFSHDSYEISKYRNTHPKLYSSNKSIVFKIIRDLIMNLTDKKWEEQSSDIGEFRISWNTQLEFEYILKGMCEIFKKSHKLNYLLWKRMSLKNKQSKIK